MRAGMLLAVAALFGQEALPPEMLDPVARLGAVGVLGFIVVWLVTKTLPAKDKAFTAVLDEITKRNHEGSEKLAEALQELRVNCERKQ